MIYSAGGEIAATVAAVGFESESGGCAASDFANVPDGAIVLAPPGPCRRREVVLNAVQAGATALVVAYPQWPAGEVRRPTLLFPDGIEIPALSASGAVGEALRAAAEAGALVRIGVTTHIGQAMVHNVIAESHAISERVVMLGGHLDSVHDGPGLNDNGSGTAALVEVARVMAEQHPAARIRLAFWGGEEFGLFGSRAYVESLNEDARAEIAAYLNFDMLGSPNFVPFVYDSADAAPGSTAISDYLVERLEALGIGAERVDIGPASDHASFDEAHIPTGGIFSGASEMKTDAQATAFGGTAGAPMDACYHLACDRVENVNVGQVAAFAGVAASLALAIATGKLPMP
jgi:Zn-dependent M28 family amino/carboxypeptidase